MMKLGVDNYLDYTKDNYWEIIKEVDFVIDTLGPKEFKRELSILKKGGRLLSFVQVQTKSLLKKMDFHFGRENYFQLRE